MENKIDIIGNGVYSITEASKYTNMPHQTLYSWFKGGDPDPLVGNIFLSDYSSLKISNDISFYDLIDAFVANHMRTKKISFQKIRKFYNKLKKDWGVAHPFCKEQFYLKGKDLIVKETDIFGETILRDVLTDQEYFMEFESAFEKMDYIQEMVFRWNIYEGVLIDPTINFGKPVVKTDNHATRVSTKIIYDSYIANDEDSEFVGELYQIKSQDVINAVRFEESLFNRKAA